MTLLAEFPQSTALGEALQERIRKTIAEDVEKSARFSEALPNPVRDVLSLSSAKFLDGGDGRLSLGVAGEASLGPEQARALFEALQRR